MQYINGIPLIWDEEADRKLMSGLFPAGLPAAPKPSGYGGAVTFENGFNDSPFGPYWDNPQTVNIDNQGKFQQLPKSNKWLYKLIQDADGLKLIDRYKKQQYLEDESGSMQDEETDIHIYYEKNDGYNNFGTICLVRMNIALHNYVAE
jgi:hypothetical protein